MRRRKLIKTLGFLGIGVVALGACGYLIVWPLINDWRQGKDLRAAELYEQQGDTRRALLTLEQAVQIFPDNMEAKRRLANFYERAGQRQALVLWKEVARLQPNDPRNLLGLAGASLRFGDVGASQEPLRQLREAGHTSADYYRLAAGLALITHDDRALEENLSQLARLLPDDLRVRLNLAITHLRQPDAAQAEAGREALLDLAHTDSLRIRAVVELFNDIARRWPKPTVERSAAFHNLALTLTPPTGPRLDPPEVGDAVERLLGFAMRQPSPASEDAVALLNVMTRNGRAAAAFEWIDSLPEKTRDAPPIKAAVTDAALQSGDLPRLRRQLLAGAWGGVPPEAINRAMAARNSDGTADRATWTTALGSCYSSLAGFRMLLRLAEAWNWPDERQQVLTAVTHGFPREDWAWRQLISYALARGDAEQVGQVYQRWSQAEPGNTMVQIEAAIMALLLQQRGAPAPRDTADFLRQLPNHPGAAVAHALALWRNQRAAEAIPLLEALPRAAFEEPRFALAYGLLLAEVGRAQESEQMLNRATANRLLPDERLLAEQARARNQLRLSLPRSQ